MSITHSLVAPISGHAAGTSICNIKLLKFYCLINTFQILRNAEVPYCNIAAWNYIFSDHVYFIVVTVKSIRYSAFFEGAFFSISVILNALFFIINYKFILKLLDFK